MGLDITRYHLAELEERKLDGVSAENNNNLAYLRSAYNSIGFNNICREHQLADMYDIFTPAIWQGTPGSDYYIVLDRDKLPGSIVIAKMTKAGLMAIENIDKYYLETIDTIIAMLTEMHETGYGLVLAWSS